MHHTTVRPRICAVVIFRTRLWCGDVRRPYVMEWEAKQNEIKDLTSKGIVPFSHDMDEKQKKGEKFSFIEVRSGVDG